MKSGKSNQIKHIVGYTPAAKSLRARLMLADMNSDLITEDLGLP